MNYQTLCIPQEEFGRFDIAYLKQKYPSFVFNECPDLIGLDPLWYAIHHLRCDNVRFLLEQRVDLTRSNHKLEPPLIQIVRKWGFKDYTPEVQGKAVAIFEALINAGANPFQCTIGEVSLLQQSLGTIFFFRCLVLFKAAGLTFVLNKVLRNAFFSSAKEVIELKDAGASCDEDISLRYITFEPKMFVEVVDSNNTTSRLKWGDSLLHHSTKPGALTVFYLSGSDMSFCDCYTRDYPCGDCIFYGLQDFFEEHNEQITNLRSANPSKTIERQRIRYWSFYILRRFALKQCIGMQVLGLPALITTEILQALLGKKWPKISFYFFYTFAVTIKHYVESTVTLTY